MGAALETSNQIPVKNQGISIGLFRTFNFTGAGVTASDAGNGQVNITINGLAPNFWKLNGNNEGVLKYIGTNDNFDFPIYTNGVQRAVVKNTGFVGINRTSPSNQLDIATNQDFVANTGVLRLRNLGAGVNDHSETAILFNVSVGNNPDFNGGRIYHKYDGNNVDQGRITIQVKNAVAAFTDMFSVDSTGIGINQTAPLARIHSIAAGTTNFTSSVIIQDSSLNYLFFVGDDGFTGVGTNTPTTANSRFQVDQNSYNEVAKFRGFSGGNFDAFTITKDGNTISEQFAQVKAGMSFGSSGFVTNAISIPDSWDFFFGSTDITNVATVTTIKNANAAFVFTDPVNTVMMNMKRIAGSYPQVGIGIASPTATLHIQGLDQLLSTFSLKVDDSLNNPLLYVRNNGTINIPEIQGFANNAAALAGGLLAGDVYYTDTVGEFILKLTH